MKLGLLWLVWILGILGMMGSVQAQVGFDYRGRLAAWLTDVFGGEDGVTNSLDFIETTQLLPTLTPTLTMTPTLSPTPLPTATLIPTPTVTPTPMVDYAKFGSSLGDFEVASNVTNWWNGLLWSGNFVDYEVSFPDDGIDDGAWVDVNASDGVDSWVILYSADIPSGNTIKLRVQATGTENAMGTGCEGIDAAYVNVWADWDIVLANDPVWVVSNQLIDAMSDGLDCDELGVYELSTPIKEVDRTALIRIRVTEEALSNQPDGVVESGEVSDYSVTLLEH